MGSLKNSKNNLGYRNRFPGTRSQFKASSNLKIREVRAKSQLERIEEEKMLSVAKTEPKEQGHPPEERLRAEIENLKLRNFELQEENFQLKELLQERGPSISGLPNAGRWGDQAEARAAALAGEVEVFLFVFREKGDRRAAGSGTGEEAPGAGGDHFGTAARTRGFEKRALSPSLADTRQR